MFDHVHLPDTLSFGDMEYTPTSMTFLLLAVVVVMGVGISVWLELCCQGENSHAGNYELRTTSAEDYTKLFDGSKHLERCIPLGARAHGRSGKAVNFYLHCHYVASSGDYKLIRMSQDASTNIKVRVKKNNYPSFYPCDFDAASGHLTIHLGTKKAPDNCVVDLSGREPVLVDGSDLKHGR